MALCDEAWVTGFQAGKCVLESLVWLGIKQRPLHGAARDLLLTCAVIVPLCYRIIDCVRNIPTGLTDDSKPCVTKKLNGTYLILL